MEEIARLLRKALLHNGEMAYSLYEYELEEHIDYWYDGLVADSDEFVFTVTENTGHVAMVLITKEKTIFINEVARAKLSQLWSKAYKPNMEMLIPVMARQLADGILSVNGVKTKR